MAETNLGRVAIVPKGTYSASVQYVYLDLVYYNGSSYLVHTQPTIGTAPTDTDYWYLVAEGTEIEMRYDAGTEYIQWKLITDSTWNNLIQPADFNPAISQVIGTSTTEVMSQNAVTNELSLKMGISDYTTPSKNLFDKSAVIEGYYISAAAGSLSGNGTSAVSPIIPVEGNTIYFLSGKTDNRGEMRYFDALGNLLKPIYVATGLESDNFNLAGFTNGQVKTPVTAVSVQFVVKFVGTGSYDNIQFEKSSVQTSYASFLPKINLSAIEVVEATPKPRIVYNSTVGGVSYIQGSLNTTHNIEHNFYVTKAFSYSVNPCFNFDSVYTVNKSTLASTLVHGNSDDIAPANYNGTYIGGAHGCSDYRSCTVASHGKTFVDIGSRWTDGTNEFWIMAIIDANTLGIMGANYLAYPKWAFTPVTTGATLSHLSGATHTASFTISTASVAQLLPSVKVQSTKIYADGVEITESGSYEFDELDICEIYDVCNPASVLEVIKAAVGTFTANPVFNDLGADNVARHSIIYRYSGANKIFITTNFTAYQALNLNYFGFMQQIVLSGSTVKMYIPKSLPINSKDYRAVTLFNTVSAEENFTSEYWENPLSPPDRYVQMSENIALNAGYLFDYGVGGSDRKDLVDNAMFIYTSRKCYPHGIDDKLTISAGDNYSAVCFKHYLDRATIDTGGIVSQNGFEYEGAYYIYADYSAVGIYEIDVPSNFIGKKIEILENSSNMSLLTEIATSKILVKMATASPLYGYMVAKIE